MLPVALWSMETIEVRGKRRERPRPLATNQIEQVYMYYQPLGQEKKKTYPISTATKTESGESLETKLYSYFVP